LEENKLIYSTNSNYPYLFSIVMAVYNVEDYIEEAIQSVINQELDFKSHIQLILVNDGSPDDSKKICERYQKQYPENIVYLEKENGGVSSARNLGLKHVKGKYVNFLDPDDKLSGNALGEVFVFFEKHFEAIDVAVIPIQFFEGSTGEHILNYKFSKTRVIDLTTEASMIQLHIASSFIKSSWFQSNKGWFNEELKYAEDAELINRMLLHKYKLGVVSSVKYLYRKRDSGSSALQTSTQKKEWYTTSLEGFSINLIHYCINNMGEVPKFIQYTIMYDLQWKINIPQIDSNVLNQTEQKKFISVLSNVLTYIDDEIIWSQRHMNVHRKKYALDLKNPNDSKYRLVHFHNDVLLYCNSILMSSLKEQTITINFLEITDNSLHIEGVFSSLFDSNDIAIVVKSNVNTYQTEYVNRPHSRISSFGVPIKQFYGFTAQIPLTEEQFGLYIRCGSTDVGIHLNFSRFVKLNAKDENSYVVMGDKLITYTNKFIVVERARNSSVLSKEVSYLKGLFASKSHGSKKAILARFVYRILKFLIRKPIWLYSDRRDRADDNAEHLFRYAVAQKDGNRHFFVINKNSPDYLEMKRTGRVLAFGSYKHKLYHLLASKVISSHADEHVLNPFFDLEFFYRDLNRFEFVFLQHGIIKDDLSNWLNKYNKNIKKFITSANEEYKSITGGNYGYSEKNVFLSGLPRYDLLKNQNKKQILIMPTWRNYLIGPFNRLTGKRDYNKSFKLSNYFHLYNQLINDQRLIAMAKEHGYQLIFFPHPNIQQQLCDFEISDDIVIPDPQTKYRVLFNESDLLITDYSSVAFDMAYMKKPVLYFQFEENHLEEGYFDYEEMGFGEVIQDYELLVQKTIDYMMNKCEMKDAYKQRVDEFYAYTDRNNCKRVYEEIRKM